VAVATAAIRVATGFYLYVPAAAAIARRITAGKFLYAIPLHSEGA
jgi:hypothetical protein